MPEPTQSQALAPFWKRDRAKVVFISAVLFAVTLAVFAPGLLQNGFVNYDDTDYITANPHVQAGLTWAGVRWAFTTGHASNWHPLTWISHMLDWQLFGDHPGRHHLVNALLHAANAVLVFLFAWRLTGFVWRSALLAMLFAWHPLHVESVAWASERKDVLSALFFFLTLISYLAYARTNRANGGQGSILSFSNSWFRSRGSLFYWMSVELFALGLLSKPMLVTTPFVLLLLDYYLVKSREIIEGRGLRIEGRTPQVPRPKSIKDSKAKGRTTVQIPKFKTQNLKTVENSTATSEKPGFHVSGFTFRALILEKFPFLLLSVASCAVTYYAQRHGGAVSTSISLGARLLNAVVACALYIRNMFWPADLAVLYPHPGYWPMGHVLAAALLLTAVSAAVFHYRRGRPWLVVGWLWFLGMLVPVIGLVQVGVQSMADRYTYLPMIGLFFIVVWAVSEFWSKRPAASKQTAAPWRQAAITGCAGIVLAGCIAGTIHQIGYWRTSQTLFEHAAAVTKGNYLAYNNLGYYFYTRGKVDDAIRNYREAIRINPQYYDVFNNLGYALAESKRYNEAIEQYRAALRIRPERTEIHNNLGNVYSDAGRVDEAIAEYRIVLQTNPKHADAHNNLGIALAVKGQFEEAISHFKAAIELKKDYSSAHSNLGNALAVQHKIPEAIAEYKECLRLNANDAQAHNNLGNALVEMGDLKEAVVHYRRALELNTNNPEAHYNYGLALKRLGSNEDGNEHFKEALRLKSDYVDARKQLETAGRR